MKQILTALALVALVGLVSMPAQGAAKTVTGKITAIDGTKVTIAIEGDRPDFIRKNGTLKFKVGPGKILELSAADAKPFTIVVNIKKAADLKVGDEVTFEKGLAVSGC
jgi:hypothetical protein